MKQLSRIAAGLATALLVMLAPLTWSAADDATAAEQRIRQNLQQSGPGLAVASVKPSEVPGLYAVQFEQGPMVYATADGHHFVLGDLFRVEAGSLTNLTERQRDQVRAELMGTVQREQTIVYAAEGTTRAVVSVFTDVECPWCQRMHAEVPALNALGIEVRYLAYPRAGIGSPAYRKMVSAWCARDPGDAMDRLKKQQAIADVSCADNPVAAHYELGNQLGVSGTPALITEQGRLLPGYMPADRLAAELGLTSAH